MRTSIKIFYYPKKILLSYFSSPVQLYTGSTSTKYNLAVMNSVYTGRFNGDKAY